MISNSPRKLKNTLPLILLIFISVIALISIGIVIGSAAVGGSVVSDAFMALTHKGGDPVGPASPPGFYLEVLVSTSVIVTLLICWTLFLLHESRHSSERVNRTKRALDQEKEKRKETKNILDQVNQELNRTASRLSDIIEGTSDIISAIDSDYRIICFNEAYKNDARRLYGVDIEVGTNILEIQGAFPEAQAASKTLWDRALGGERFSASENFVDEENRSYSYDVTYNPLRNEDGLIIGASHIVRDVTERTQAEESLKRERDFITTIVEASNLLVMVTDLEGRIVKFNHGCEEISGYKFEEIKGRVFWNVLVHPEEAANIKRSFRNVTEESFGQNYVSHWITKDEEMRLISWRNSVIEDDEGTKFLIATGIDVTEKEEFKETQDRILDILEKSSDFIGISDLRGNINYLNGAAMKMLALNPSVDKSQIKMINAYPDWAAKLVQTEGVPTAIKRGSWIGETAVKNSRGREIPVSQLILAHKNERGEVEYLSTIARDISRQKRLEKELSATRDAALETVKLKSEFLANMSHEIRTPMNGIIGLAELLLSTKLDSEQRDYVESVQRSGEILLTIVNDILDFSKIEAGKFQMESVNFELRETLESVLEIFAEPAHRKGIEIALSVENDVPNNMFGDPRRVRQILTNLLANAVKFTAEGEVIIRVKRSQQDLNSGSATLHFSVTDTGIGIASDAQEGLFDAFTQADKSITRRFGGTGLGLAISKQLVEMMNGEIGVSSEPGNGSTFWFTAEFDSENSVDFSKAYRKALVNVRALIVDDNASIRNILVRQVKSIGVVGDEASSGAAALKMLRAAAKNGEPFQIAVIDLQMPEMNGIELSKAIKNDPVLRKTRILLMPSISDHVMVKEAKTAGVDKYIYKPIRPTEFFGNLCDLTVDEDYSFGSAEDQAGGPESNNGSGVDRQESEGVSITQPSEVKILIAEDNLVNQKVISSQIQRLGYSADLTADGKEVLEALEKNEYSLILMDCQMPVMDGLTATEEIRKAEAGSDRRIPIIAITALAVDGDRERCLAIGMDDYITKPTKQDQLESIINRWVNPQVLQKQKPAAVQEPEPESPESEYIELRMKELAETCGDEVTLECIELFLDDFHNSIKLLIESIEDLNFEMVACEAHKLKGSSSNMGAARLPKMCAEVVKATRENRFSDIDSYVEPILNQYQTLIPIYESLRSAYAARIEKLQPAN